MDARLQRRVQRYGWDLAAAEYETLWQAQLAVAQDALLAQVALRPGESVLDVACGTGLVSLRAAALVGAAGTVLGTDLSARMIDAATHRAGATNAPNARFERMDAEAMNLRDDCFDVALCALGLMYVPDPEQALREMQRVVRPGGRLGVVVWAERTACGWSAVFPIVDEEVSSEVCPLFFRMGEPHALEGACVDAGFAKVQSRRIDATLVYANANEACDAAFKGGPVALAWSRFDAVARARVRERYLASIDAWRAGGGYRVPASFVLVSAQRP